MSDRRQIERAKHPNTSPGLRRLNLQTSALRVLARISCWGFRMDPNRAADAQEDVAALYEALQQAEERRRGGSLSKSCMKLEIPSRRLRTSRI
jgi:hypothetical protein